MKKYLIVGETGHGPDELLYDTDDSLCAEIRLAVELGRGADAYMVTDYSDAYADSLIDMRIP